MQEEKVSPTQKSSLEPKRRHSWDALLDIHAHERCSLFCRPHGRLGIDSPDSRSWASEAASQWPLGGCPLMDSPLRPVGGCPLMPLVCLGPLSAAFFQLSICPSFQNTAHAPLTASSRTLSWGGADLMPEFGPFLSTPTSPLLRDSPSGHASCFWSVFPTGLWGPREGTISYASWISRT